MNASTYFYVCQHNTDDDAKYMAKKLGVDLTMIPREPLRFLMWSPAKGNLARGVVTFKHNRPVFQQQYPVKRTLAHNSMLSLFNGMVNP